MLCGHRTMTMMIFLGTERAAGRLPMSELGRQCLDSGARDWPRFYSPWTYLKVVTVDVRCWIENGVGGLS